MPGGGRPADPLWSAIGFAIGIAPGIYFHQLGLGVGLGIVLAGAFGLVRADIKNKYTRPADPLWFAIGLAIGILGGLWLHFLGLGWDLASDWDWFLGSCLARSLEQSELILKESKLEETEPRPLSRSCICYLRASPQKIIQKIIFTLHLISRMLTAANLHPAEFLKAQGSPREEAVEIGNS